MRTIQCPNCNDTYNIKCATKKIIKCLHCNEMYTQFYHDTSTPYFVRQALHKVKGE